MSLVSRNRELCFVWIPQLLEPEKQPPVFLYCPCQGEAQRSPPFIRCLCRKDRSGDKALLLGSMQMLPDFRVLPEEFFSENLSALFDQSNNKRTLLFYFFR